ncbi:MAG: purine-binding chemotaxis protein CheW [Pseudomonadales bacterium]|nr:purine-binding chemotaxis protein CheW [Pseudomonadales bacterium]
MAARGFLKLLEFAERARQRTLGLPVEGEQVEYWSGIGFRLLGHNFVATMGEVVEVLSIPRYTGVPGVQSWMRGLSNVRGRLLPIMDLPMYFSMESKVAESRRRVVVVDMQDIFSGLVVDEVLGVQHFPVKDYRAEPEDDIFAGLQPYLQGAFWREGQYWSVFSLSRLIEDPRFMQVSAA